MEIAGTTGNIYHVHIAQEPSCDCPHAMAGNQCKHWMYVSWPLMTALAVVMIVAVVVAASRGCQSWLPVVVASRGLSVVSSWLWP